MTLGIQIGSKSAPNIANIYEAPNLGCNTIATANPTYNTNIYTHEHECSMNTNKNEFINVSVHATYIYVYACTCTYMDIQVHEFMNMFVHVCILFRHICTVLQYLVHEGRIPDGCKTEPVLLSVPVFYLSEIIIFSGDFGPD
jgi:hypothetical protein